MDEQEVMKIKSCVELLSQRQMWEERLKELQPQWNNYSETVELAESRILVIDNFLKDLLSISHINKQGE